METVKTKKFELPNKKIIVKPIIRKGGWLPDDHDGKFMYTGAKNFYPVPVGPGNVLVNPLNEEEQEYFENLYHMERGGLSVHNQKNNFWKNRGVSLDKNGQELILSNPDDYLSYKILLANPHLIAPSQDKDTFKATQTFYLLDTTVEIRGESERIQVRKKAYNILSKIDTSKAKMIDFILVYRMNNRDYTKLPQETTKDALYIIIEDIIAKDAEGFIRILDDPDYAIKVAVQKMILNGMAVINPHLKNRYTVKDTDLVGYPLELVGLLKEPANEVIKSKLLMQLSERDKLSE